MRKTPARSWRRKHFAPGYFVFHKETKDAVLGCGGRMFDASIEDVESFAADLVLRR